MNMKWKERLAAIGRGLVKSVRDFPVEAMLCLTMYVLMILEDNGIGWSNESVFVFAVPQFLVMFCLHRASKRPGRFRGLLTGLYVFSLFLWIPVWLWYRDPSPGIVVPTYIISLILLLAGTCRQDNGTYARNILQILLKGFMAAVVSAVLAGVIAGIIGSVDFLFVPGDLDGNWYEYPSAFCGMVVFPLLSCLFVMDEKPVGQGSRFITILFDIILSPALLIYTVILYLYIIRILVRWELPDGGVAYMVGSYVGVALVCYLYQELLEKRHFDWFYRYFPAIAAAPLALLWTGIARRIGEYGLTETRFFLILAAILLSLFTVMLLFRKSRSFQLMSVIAALALALFSYIPGIRGHDFGIYAQAARLERVLPLLAENPLLEKEAGIADGALDYLWHELPADKFKSRYGSYERDRYTTAAVTPPFDSGVPGKEIEHIQTAQVDLGEYTMMIPPSRYYYYEDERYGVFYRDAARTVELIRCDVTARLDDGSVQEDRKLVFQNESYLVVYHTVTDYRPTQVNCRFTTGGHTLFAKP